MAVSSRRRESWFERPLAASGYVSTRPTLLKKSLFEGKALVGDRRVRDVAAQLFDTLAIIGITAHPGIRAEAVGAGAVHIAQVVRFVQWATLTHGPQELQKGRNHNTVW